VPLRAGNGVLEVEGLSSRVTGYGKLSYIRARQLDSFPIIEHLRAIGKHCASHQIRREQPLENEALGKDVYHWHKLVGGYPTLRGAG